MMRRELHKTIAVLFVAFGVTGMVFVHAVGAVLGMFLVGVGAPVPGAILLLITAASVLRTYQKTAVAYEPSAPTITQGIGEWGIFMAHTLGIVTAGLTWEGSWWVSEVHLVAFVISSYVLTTRIVSVRSTLARLFPDENV